MPSSSGLASYKELNVRWHDWASVTAVCTDMADLLLEMIQRSES